MKNVLRKVLLFLVTLPVIAILLQAVWFYSLLSSKGGEPPEKADAIIVFAGCDERIRAGYELACKKAAKYLVISPASSERLEKLDAQYGPINPHVQPIAEPWARTTFENALWTRKLVDEYGLESVILVTSSYHMPRSYFLARLLLVGTGVRIERHAVVQRYKKASRLVAGCPPKVLYREMLEFWGSLFELARYLITGSLPSSDPSELQPFKQLRPLLLQ